MPHRRRWRWPIHPRAKGFAVPATLTSMLADVGLSATLAAQDDGIGQGTFLLVVGLVLAIVVANTITYKRGE